MQPAHWFQKRRSNKASCNPAAIKQDARHVKNRIYMRSRYLANLTVVQPQRHFLFISINNCIVFVLMGWSFLPNVLRPFKIYCAPPNLGIRTWICRSNFCSEAYIFRLELLWRVWNLRLGTPSLKYFLEDLCSGFLRPVKIHRSQSGLNSRTLDLGARTLPRDHRGRLN